MDSIISVKIFRTRAAPMSFAVSDALLWRIFPRVAKNHIDQDAILGNAWESHQYVTPSPLGQLYITIIYILNQTQVRTLSIHGVL